MDSTRVFVIYEPVYTMRDVEILERVHADLVCRGWFRWYNAPNWESLEPLEKACREKGIMLQGGGTCAAIYPDENGIGKETFLDFATADLLTGKPHLIAHGTGGWYHVSLYNPKVIEYLKKGFRLQIDAGAVGLWYDEIEGYYDWEPTEGYDPYTCAAFRDWLILKYCAGQKWKDDDERWKSVFNIDLAQHGGTIKGFDYRKHLLSTSGKDGKPLADDPPQGNPRQWETSPNPLYREWGFAWDRRAKGTFRFDTTSAIFADMVADANRYAKEKHKRTLINTYNHNGTARPGVDFLQPHNGAQPPISSGRLNGHPSYMNFYDRVIRDAAEVCPRVPVVFFVDWPSESDKLASLPASDQMLFFSIYIPEAYAAGGEFALPVQGYSYRAVEQGTLGYLAKLSDFYREYFPWLRNSLPVDCPVKPPENITVRVRRSTVGTAVHVINHRFSDEKRAPEKVGDLKISIPWMGAPPAGAFAVSPDYPEQMPVRMESSTGELSLTLPELTSSAIILLPKKNSLRRLEGTAASGTHISAPGHRTMTFSKDGRFTLWVPNGTRAIECLESAERLPAKGALRFKETSGEFASGVLMDELRVPLRGMKLSVGKRIFFTDVWGRYRIPLAAGSSAALAAKGYDRESIPIRKGFTSWQLFPGQQDSALKELWTADDAQFDRLNLERL